MSNQVEQIRAEVERRIKSWQAGIKYEGDAGDCQSRVTELTDLKKFIDSLPAKENPILVPESKETPIEVCGKKVVVKYTRDGHPCEKCIFGESDNLCADGFNECSKLDKVGMEIDERAYFVEAPQPIQGSIAPDADLDELIKQEMVKVYETYTRPDYIEENTTEAAYDFDAHIARHFAEWGAEHLKK